jgi:PAS domain S-box-containing protein
MDLSAAAFACVVALADVSPALPHHPPPVLRWWLAGVCLTVVVGGLCLLARTHVLGRTAQYPALVLFFVAVQMLRAADGNGSAGFTPLLILPVVWCALYGDRRSLFLALFGVAAVQFGPLILVGGPEYPVTLWRAGVLWVLILALIGVAARQLVAALREKTAALAASQARFQAAFNDAPVGVALVGAAGNQIGAYLAVNRAMCAMLGREEGELVGRSVLDFTRPEDRGRSEQHLVAPPESKLAHTLEKRYLHSSGREVHASVTYSRIHAASETDPYFIVHVQDTTPRRQAELEILTALEQQAKTATRLHRLDETRAVLFAVGTDGIRKPLAGIRECVVKLARSPATLASDQLDRVREIDRHVDRLEATASDLISLAETREVDVQPAPEAIDIESIVRGAIDSIRPIALGREQALQVEVNASAGQVRGDADQIDRVLMNLLDNAVKFTPPGGAIDTQVRVRDEIVEIQVSDTGIGIDGDEIDRIFDRYYRARAAREQAIPGSGLGLAIVKAIADQHSGAIEVFSERGVGSTFKFVMPL